ncbi:uncharacterized protein LOC132037596 [Lycium ferocissimum]|uniref:uncharacterized protein LOC132037596 n=1 Tax=Lycium ferocissimum TaxID=112874 RepID=UPI002815EAFF|nr:uncharacterized protein LOC132037596 [Lycium ferocissimum]
MKQKVVIRLSLSRNDQKCRSKAFKIAVSQPGVESAAIQGDGKNQLEVVGEQIDAVTLTSSLRKNLGQAELVSAGPATAAGNKDKSSDIKASVVPVTIQSQPYYYPYYAAPQYPVYQVRDSYQQEGCSIM